MPDLYQHEPHKFSDAGINLRFPVDLIPPGQYAQLQNAVAIIEGQLTTRGALSWIAKVANATSPGSGTHSLTRLNQPASASTGDRIAGIDTSVQTLALPSGNTAVSRDAARTGDPLSLPTFHFANDTDAWQVLADRAGMKKYKGGPSPTYVNLGLLSPALQHLNSAASAVAAGVGNLNNGAGPAYDWRYTYVNTKTLSESNPSALNLVASYVSGPAAGATPDPNLGGVAGVGFAGGAGGTLAANSAAETRQSGNWTGWPAGTIPFQSLTLYLRFQINTLTPGTTGGVVFGAVQISLDGGSTWHLVLDFLANLPITGMPANGWVYPVFLPVSQDLTKLQARFVTLGVGNTTIPQNVTARRIRERGGIYTVTDLLTGGGGNAATQVTFNLNQVAGVDVTQTATLLALANQQATVTCINPFDPQVDAIRLYRRGGSVTASWAFVGQFPVTAHDGSAFNVTDNIADANLGGFISLDNDPPVNSVFTQAVPLPYVWGPGFNPSRLFGCGDPNRPDAVYFSNPGNADQWGVGQWVDVSSPSDPMQNGCVFNTRVFAFSKERMFELLPGVLGGSTLTPFQTPCSRGLISPWGLVANARAIAFVAKDGVYITTGGEELSLVEDSIKPIFPTLDMPGRQISFATGAQVDAVNMERIEDIRLRFHNDELWFIYRGLVTGNLQTLIFDTQKKRWRTAKYGDPGSIVTIYSEEGGPQSSLLLGSASGDIFTTTRGGPDAGSGGVGSSTIAVQVQTGAYDQGMPLSHKEYGGVIFDIDPGGATGGNPITITPLINGETVTEAALTITGSGRQQFPLDFLSGGLPFDIIGYNIEFLITWNVTASSQITPVLYQFDLIWRPEPTPLVHWEVRETSHSLPGWQHIRDMYVCLRSSATVTLTMTFDNNYTQTYTIASTGGLRSKVYLPFNSNKFKLVRYSFDSSQAFKIYWADSEVRVKPWLTTLGYQVIRAFGQEDTQAAQALEAAVLGGK